MEYQKGIRTSVSLHFNSTDFDCHCKFDRCKTTIVEPLLVEGLEVLWKLSKGFTITSGFRCKDHNMRVGGAQGSQHLLGKAADCKSTHGYNGNLMSSYAEKVPPFHNGGIGIYFNWVHVDIRFEKARWAFPRGC